MNNRNRSTDVSVCLSECVHERRKNSSSSWDSNLGLSNTSQINAFTTELPELLGIET